MKVLHKAAAIVIQDNKFLVVKKVGKDIWTSLGGKLEAGETEEECLLREIKEEFNCGAKIIKKLGDFEDKAVFDDAIIRLSAFLVNLKGEIDLIDPELEEYKFIEKSHAEKLPSTLKDQVIPLLIKKGLLNW